MDYKLHKIIPLDGPKAIGPYSPAVSNLEYLFVSGQLPVDPATGKLVEGGIREQTKQVLANILKVLNAGATGFERVMRCDVFLTNLDDFSAFNEEYAKAFVGPVEPARQTVEVSRLPMGAMIEISCVAWVKTDPSKTTLLGT